jgi:putative tricarboxylic transport membrane protein
LTELDNLGVGDSHLKGTAMAALGVLLATVGLDAGTGTARCTFDSLNLLGGIPFVDVMIGLFAVGEVMEPT